MKLVLLILCYNELIEQFKSRRKAMNIMLRKNADYVVLVVVLLALIGLVFFLSQQH